jgi:hypothetical protein
VYKLSFGINFEIYHIKIIFVVILSFEVGKYEVTLKKKKKKKKKRKRKKKERNFLLVTGEKKVHLFL